MNIFLAWSGAASKAAAVALREWLPVILQHVQPFMSEEDIQKGARWRQDVAKQLSDASFAILCLTKDNLESKWLHFEAGAIATRSESNRVTALLLGIEHSAVVAPLSEFQHTSFTREDVLRLIKDINLQSGEEAIAVARLETTFNRFWPDLETALRQAMATANTRLVKTRTPEEMLTEILEGTRSHSASFQRLTSALEHLTSGLTERTFLSQSPLGLAAVTNPFSGGVEAEASDGFVNYFNSRYQPILGNKPRNRTVAEAVALKVIDFIKQEEAKKRAAGAESPPNVAAQLSHREEEKEEEDSPEKVPGKKLGKDE